MKLGNKLEKLISLLKRYQTSQYLYKIKVAFLMMCFGATPSYGQPLELKACQAYVEMLNGNIDEITEEKFKDCILYEQIIVTSPSWSEFILRFRRHISDKGYPVLLFSSLKAAEQGDMVKAFASADAALLSIAEIFTTSRDKVRAEYYTPLVLSYRNSLLEGLGLSAEMAASISQEYGSLSELPMSREGVEQSVFIRCLIGTDSFTAPLVDILNSQAFLACIGVR